MKFSYLFTESLMYFAIFPRQIVVFVLMLASGSICTREKYLKTSTLTIFSGSFNKIIIIK